MDATRTLADFTHDLDFDALPAAAVRAAAHMALDTVGSALAGRDAPAIRELAAYAAQTTRGDCRLWFGAERVAAPAATLVNSAMAHALEFDDLHSELPMHSGVVVVPAALAIADERPELTGRDLVVAIVAGTEILCRLARATRSYRGKAGFRGWNPTAVVAGFASSAVAGRLLGLDAEAIARAMGLSYAQASGNQQCIADGGLVKRMQPGLVAEAGVRAAYFARLGITGARDAIEGANGYFALYEAGDYDPEVLTDGLGETFEIEKVCFKRYPVCGMAQPAMDALKDLLATGPYRREDIGAVHVDGSKFVADMVGRPYRPGANPEVDAQFNLPYCLATILETGDFTLDDLAPERTLDPGRRALADTIPIALDPALTGKWEARVALTLQGGATIDATRTRAAWQDDRPMSEAELLQKFAVAASRGGLDGGHAERLADALNGLEALSPASSLGPLLAP